MSRRKARELSLRALYAHELSENPLDTIIDEMILGTDEEARVKEFASKLVRCAAEQREVCDRRIKEKARNWEFDRIAVIDKLIMRLAICEFLFFEDIPTKVTIDEAIEIAKKYSTEKSGQFINGILDAVLLDLRNENLIRKTGRGLQES